MVSKNVTFIISRCYGGLLLISLIYVGIIAIAPAFAAEQIAYQYPDSVTDTDFVFDPADISPTASSEHQINLMYLSSKSGLSSVPLLFGYIKGDFDDAKVIITGKENPDDTFKQIGFLTPEKTGLFLYTIPKTYQKLNYFQAIGIFGEEAVLSDITPLYPAETKTQTSLQTFVASPVSQPISPSMSRSLSTPVPISAPQALEKYTTLTLQADTLSPSVGDTVTLSGRLTDSAGNGIARAQIGVEVPEISGEPSSTPLSTTRTDKEGRFRTTISTWQPGTVSIHVSYKGDDTHLPATSNPLMINAHE